MKFKIGFLVCHVAILISCVSSAPNEKSSDSKTDLPPCGKYERFYDIPLSEYHQIFYESEHKIIKDLPEILKRNQDNQVAKGKLLTLSGLLNLFRKKHGIDTKTKKEEAPPKTPGKSPSATTRYEENMEKYLHYFSLPPEIRNKIALDMGINDFGMVADIAEHEKCVNVSMFARGWITTRIFGKIDDWRRQLSTSRDVEKRIKEADDIINDIVEFDSEMPTDYVSPVTQAQKLVLLFKMVAAIVNVYIPIEAMDRLKKHVWDVIDKVDGLEYFTHLLTFHDHDNIIKCLKEGSYKRDQEGRIIKEMIIYNGSEDMSIWYIYFMILKESPHLKKKFTMEMMADINEFRVFVHGCLLVQQNQKTKKCKYQKIFTLDWTLFVGEQPTPDQLDRFNLEFAKRKVSVITGRETEEQYALAFGAIQELHNDHSSERFHELMYFTYLNLVVFRRNRLSSCKIMYEKLKSLADGSKVSSTSMLRQTLAIVKDELKHRSLAKTYYDRVIKRAIEPKDLKMFFEFFVITITTNMYEDNVLTFIHDTFFKFANDPHLFDDMEMIKELNRLHNDKYGLDMLDDRMDYIGVLNEFRQKFKDEKYGIKEDDPDKNFKRIIYIKMQLGLTLKANQKFSDDATAERPEEYKEIIIDVLTRFDALARKIGDEMADDGGVIIDHSKLVSQFEHIVDQHYSNPKDVQITQQPLDELKISNTNPFIYIQLVLLAKFKYSESKIPTQMLQNILALEAKVFNVVRAYLIHSDMIQHRFLFYAKHTKDVKDHMKSKLNAFVEKCMNLAICQDGPYSVNDKGARIVENAQQTLIAAIYSAIEENPDAEKLIEAETMVNLERFITNFRKEYLGNEAYFQAEIKENYEKWQKRLSLYIEAEEARLKK